MTEHRHGQSRFRGLVGADLSFALADILLDWLHEAHEVAACMNDRRYDGPRGPWNNPASYGTDRYQYLAATAEHLPLELPQIRPSTRQKPHLLHIGEKCSIYQFHAPGNSPCGPLLNSGEFQRALAEPDATGPELALLTEAQCWLGDRELILMPWAEDLNRDLAQVWVGQGTRAPDEAIEWSWLHPLQDVVDESEIAHSGHAMSGHHDPRARCCAGVGRHCRFERRRPPAVRQLFR